MSDDSKHTKSPRRRRSTETRRIPKVILLLESSRASGRNLLRGIAEFARHHGPWSFYWEPRGLEAVWRRMDTLDAEGIILRDVGRVDDVVARRLPAVVVGHSRTEIPGLVNVVTDSATIGFLAAEHLLDCGFCHFGYCGLARSAIEMTPWSQQRGESFRRRLQQAGFEPHLYQPPSPPRHTPTPRAREREPIAQWLASLPKPVGVMACNDDRAQQVVEACKVAGLAVPDDVAILGADNDELVCELTDPPLSSVEINFQRAGYESARALQQLMRGKRPASMTIPARATHVVPRQSTDVIFLDDPRIVQALRFIRTQCRCPVGVNDVAAAAGLSRRVLEKRFRRLLHRSVLTEIRRVRVEQICRLLVETTQPVSQIAAALDYADVQHVSRYFHREKAMTPIEFRKRFGRHP
ncbi:MAG: DNA-binding transcriptional regulator [Verrucomicrobia bacterium]|nr:DNA-binding transcriptional regulator [Verrucomicrobiota bacterium]